MGYNSANIITVARGNCLGEIVRGESSVEIVQEESSIGNRPDGYCLRMDFIEENVKRELSY